MSDTSWEQEFACYAALVKALAEIGEREMASDFLQAASAGNAALNAIKTLGQYADEVKDAQKRGEFMQIIGELSIKLADTQIALSQFKDKVNSLEKEVERLREPEIELVKAEGFYYDTQDKTIPLCPNCYISSKKLRILSRDTWDIAGIGYQCPECSWKGFLYHKE